MTRCGHPDHRKLSSPVVYCCRRVLSIASLGLVLAAAGCGTSAVDNGGSPASAYDTRLVPAADALTEGAAAEAEQIARDIEEADVVKIVGAKLYALNSYKGLLIIDITNADAPALLGRFDLRGRGVEMYVVGTQVCVLLSADWYFYVAGGAAESDILPLVDGPVPPAPEFQGSQLAIIDVSNPAAPAIKDKLDLAGYADQSRRVGDIIYITGTNYIPFDHWVSTGDTVDEGFVASVSVANPGNIVPVERKTFAGTSLAIHVSDTTLFAAGQDYDPRQAQGFTHIQVLDISDPAGAIAIRGAFDVPGRIQNRFFMDDYLGVFRIVTESWGFGFRTVNLYTYNLGDLDHVTPLGGAEIIRNESLRAVRFDGPRGYAVTYFQVDPLFVLDLSDAANPVVAGQLEVPGFSTYIEPRGNRLIAVGIDDTEGSRPALAYYDVQDPANPVQLSRIVLGPPGSFTDSEAVYDEKAFKVVDDLGLIAIPFQHVSYDAVIPASGSEASSSDISIPACKNAVQLVDFDDSGLTQRGWFEHKGRVQRVGVIDGRVFALSSVSFQTVAITDRDNPSKMGEIIFLSDDELPYWDDCSGWFWPPDDGVPLDWWLSGNWCGVLGIVPTALLTCSLWLMKGRRSLRRFR